MEEEGCKLSEIIQLRRTGWVITVWCLIVVTACDNARVDLKKKPAQVAKPAEANRCEERKVDSTKSGAKQANAVGYDRRQASTRRASKEAALSVDSVAIIYSVVDVQPKFPGGDAEWRKFLERNFNRDVEVENGMPAEGGSIVASFVVGDDGCVSDVIVENNPGRCLAEEFVRVIKLSGRWQPAIKNGRYVAYRQRQSIFTCIGEE